MTSINKFIITRTIARFIFDQKHLETSFFFSRSESDLDHVDKFVNIFAYQLTKISSILKRFICNVIIEQDDIIHQDLDNQ